MKTIKPTPTYCGDICTAVTGPVSDVYTATLQDGQVVEVTDAVTAVLVTDFVYYLPGKIGEQLSPTYLHCTAAEYTKWMRA
jgi:hypothetical protein